MAKVLMKGNEALAESALRAGCRFFSGYPITPQTEILEYMSWRMKEVGGEFVQTESEVAGINMLFGAAAAGARALTSPLLRSRLLLDAGGHFLSVWDRASRGNCRRNAYRFCAGKCIPRTRRLLAVDQRWRSWGLSYHRIGT